MDNKGSGADLAIHVPVIFSYSPRVSGMIAISKMPTEYRKLK